MTREQIIRIAREAGFGIGPATKSIYANTPCDDQLERFAALAVAAEREACAQIADEWATSEQKQFGNGGPGAAIRARGNQ